MTLAEWVAHLNQTLWVLRERGDMSLTAWHELDGLMREIYSLLPAEPSTSSNAKLEEIETRLSTLELGLGKLIESVTIMLPPEPFTSSPQHSLWSKTRESRSAKPS